MIDKNYSAIGFGAMRLTGNAPYKPPPSRRQAWATLDAVVDSDIRFIDTADTYGLGSNECLLGEFLRARRCFDLRFCTKVGQCHDGYRMWGPLGHPRYLRQQASASIQRLGGHVEVLMLHRLDPEYPADDQIRVLQEFVKKGDANFIGLSNVDADTLDRLAQRHPIRFVQNRQSLGTGADVAVERVCANRGVTLIAYAPLSMGSRRSKLESLARRAGMSPQQLSLRWALSRSNVLPIPGSCKAEHVKNWKAHDLSPLGRDVLEEIAAVIS